MNITELDQLIKVAYENRGEVEYTNKVYVALLRNRLYLPIEKITPSSVSNSPEAEPFKPLFVKNNDDYFMMAFDTLERLNTWADVYIKDMDYVAILGRDLLRGLGEHVYICLNYGTAYYKEFSPDEILHLKQMIAKIDTLYSQRT